MWAIHRISLGTHNLKAARYFFETLIGLGSPTSVTDTCICFGDTSRGIRVSRPSCRLTLQNGALYVQNSVRHLALDVSDLHNIKKNMQARGHSFENAPVDEFDTSAIYTVDPAQNLVAFCQADYRLIKDDIQPFEKDWGWGLHHVNLQAGNVRDVVDFFTDIAGCKEGKWQAPSDRGDFSIDPAELSILSLGTFNRGLHIIRPDAGFAYRNQFAHNPSIGGHPAIWVPDVMAVKARLQEANFIVTDAGMYAMSGMHQIYVLDPTANMIEINQFL